VPWPKGKASPFGEELRHGSRVHAFKVAAPYYLEKKIFSEIRTHMWNQHINSLAEKQKAKEEEKKAAITSPQIPTADTLNPTTDKQFMVGIRASARIAA